MEEKLLEKFQSNYQWALVECENMKHETIVNMAIEWTVDEAGDMIEDFLRENYDFKTKNLEKTQESH